MARLFPSRLPLPRQNAGIYRELQTVERLQQSLPDGYEIFHSIFWHSVHEETDRHGEIDVVVLGPAGNLLLMEIKAGEVILRNGEIFKLYTSGEHDIGRQCRIQYAAMVSRLTEAGFSPKITNCLVLPDYHVPGDAIVSFPKTRIIDAAEYDFLGLRVRDMLSKGSGDADIDALRHFLANEFQAVPDLSVIQDQVETTVRQLSDGLATWVPRISSPSGCFRIHATAGSGKTQLALRLMQDAAAASKSVLYVCFNRSLADHIARIAPTRAHVSNFHEMCVEHYRRQHGEPDFSSPAVFEKLAADYVTSSADFSGRYDVVIIDEGQDFEPAWLESVAAHLKQDGHLYFMEDDDQRLYERELFELADAVSITCRDNYRSPRAVCEVINALGLASAPVQSRNPYPGLLPEFHVYESEVDIADVTAQAVARLCASGFSIEDIVVLTGRGLNRSVLLNMDAIGPYKTRRFTGQYNHRGEPVWSNGELLVDSVYRFKGQHAPAIILSEIDFEKMSRQERRKLFVGVTRAQMAVDLVLSRKTGACFAALLGG